MIKLFLNEMGEEYEPHFLLYFQIPIGRQELGGIDLDFFRSIPSPKCLITDFIICQEEIMAIKWSLVNDYSISIHE